MTNDKSYNGYTNKATWMISLHINQTQRNQNLCLDICKHNDIQSAEQAIQEFIEDDLNLDNLKNPLVADLAQNTLNQVDWRQITENLYDLIAEQEQYS